MWGMGANCGFGVKGRGNGRQNISLFGLCVWDAGRRVLESPISSLAIATVVLYEIGLSGENLLDIGRAFFYNIYVAGATGRFRQKPSELKGKAGLRTLLNKKARASFFMR